MHSLKLGLKAATEDSRDLLFSTYATKAKLPKPPLRFGHDTFIPRKAWGMLGNDEWGDCAWAGPAHEHMLLNAAAGRTVSFTTSDVLSDYSANTGFNPAAGQPGDNPTDQGTDLRDSAKYRQKTGIIDAAGHRHKIGAYVWLDPGNLAQLLQATYLFGTVGIGIDFPGSAMDQFNAGKPWGVVRGASIEGGHYVPVVGRHGTTSLVTWGQRIQMTAGFYKKYCTQAMAYISPDLLNAQGASPEGFDLQHLQHDLAAL